MSTSDHWMPLHIGDYLADTMHLTPVQHGLYLLLIMHCFKHGGSLPDDDDELRRITGADAQTWRRNRITVRSFFCIGAGIMTHNRVLRELTHISDVANARKSAGKQGAAKRWNKANGMANAIDENDKSHFRDIANASNNHSHSHKEGAGAPSRARAHARDHHSPHFKNPFHEIAARAASGDDDAQC